ncbi:MAG: fasciclin domain-containing protein [Spirochaetaceae bacterium]
MRRNSVIVALILSTVVLTPVFAQVEPGSGDEETVTDVLSSHDDTSEAHELFAEEFEEFLENNENVAVFAPEDEALDDLEPADLSEDETDALFTRHVTTGLAAETPIELIDWFATADGEQIDVNREEEDDEVVLNEEAAVVETVPTENGIVYIIDDSLQS